MAKRRRSYHDHADEDIQIGMFRALQRIVEILEDGQRHQAGRVVLTPRTVQTAEMPIPPPPATFSLPSFPPAPPNLEQRLQNMSRQELLNVIYSMRQNSDATGNQSL